MPTLHHLLQTTLTFLFTLTLSFVSVYIPQPYHQVNHAEAGVATFSGQLMGLAEQAVSAAANVMSAAIESVIRFKELVWDPLAWSVAKGMIAVMTASVVRWINSGFQGSPAFVQDLEYYLSRVGDRVFGEFVNELGIAPFVCRPFRLDLQIALNIGYQRHYRAGYPIGATYCSLEGALANIDNFVNGSFNDGGWDTWYTVTTRPNTYTPYGNFLSVSGEAALRINNQQVNATRFLNFGDGFMSKAICSQIPLITGGAITRERCAVSTPGQVINQTLNHHLGAGLDSLIAADEIGEIIGALVGQLAQKSLEGAAGLLGLSGGTGYTDPSYGTSYLDAAITQQAASSSEAVAQADQLSNNTYNQAANQAEQQGQQRADNAQAGADSTTNTGIDTTNIDQALQNLIDILGGGGGTVAPTDPVITDPVPVDPTPVDDTGQSGLAFPGAVGYGAHAKGGRSGAVIYVTNLNDSGPGSLRAALTAFGPRTVIFRVGGTIGLESPIVIKNPFLTIAGQTAPGDGVLVKYSGAGGGYTTPLITINTHDVVMRYLRLRRGPGFMTECCGDNLSLSNASNVIVDHVSMSWSTDENTEAWPANNVTVQWSIITEGLMHATHSPLPSSGGQIPDHSYGAIWGLTSKNITTYSNLFVNNLGRNALMAPRDGGDFQFINNVIHNVCYAAGFDQLGSKLTRLDAIGNTIQLGPNSCRAGRQNIMLIRTQKPADGLYADGPRSVYVKDNITPNRADGQDEWLATTDGFIGPIPGPLSERSLTPHSGMPSVPALSSSQARAAVLAGAGATLPRRDSVDQRAVNYAQNGGGRLIDDPSEVGGWPVLRGGTPYPDADKDGMDDTWEIQNGFDPNDGTDGNGDRDGDGYTNLEEFLNRTTP
ncbi:MAG: hypothetical protein H6779_03920 [Candidatus Nomurabacteria bacterium]|nr:MAG: hypothetical protein H6779_03920 [Candidatus Nomurabacteria bacterium]